MEKSIKYDISVPINSKTLLYPEDPKVCINVISDDDFLVSEISMSLHSGTHIDCPLHIKNKELHKEYPVSKMVVKAYVIEIEDSVSINPEDINIEIEEDAAVLFKTQNSHKSLLVQNFFHEDYIYMTEEAAKKIVKQKPILVGFDYLSPDRFGDEFFPVHKTLLGNGIFILENADLSQVEPGKYEMFCFPLKVNDVEAMPVRAILVR